jgi:SagB-type dehydrogenase family enzyme
MLLLTNTLSAKAQYGQELFYYRTAASAGALYPTEIYVGARGVSGLENGLYHYSIRRHALFPLHGQAPPALTFFLTAVYFRSAWKYRDRAYRYHLLDTGHVAENLTLALRGIGLPFRLSYDFEDAEVNKLLGINPEKEVALALVQVPGTARGEASPRRELPEPHQVPVPGGVSPREVDYPMIREVHLAGGDRKALPVEPPDMLPHLGPTPAQWEKIQPPSLWPETMDYAEALFRRRSKRNFIQAAVGQESVSALLEALSVREGTAESYERSVSVGFLAGRVEGLRPGLHVLDREKGLTGWVDGVGPTERVAGICLDQMWLAHAGIHFLFMADLDMLERSQGNRGYRYAMMSAGRLGQRLYLSATALGLGCCGIGAFYDREAADFLGLRRSCRLLYLVAVGRVKRAE